MGSGPGPGDSQNSTLPRVSWSAGPAYDLFASLFVIHHAESTGLRKAWAAGVRNRLSPDNRRVLSAFVPAFSVPVEWLAQLGEFPDAHDALDALDHVPDSDVISRIVDEDILDHGVVRRVMERGSYRPDDVQTITGERDCKAFESADESWIGELLAACADPGSSGRGIKAALREYVERFFEEEQERIEVHQRTALARARRLAEKSSILDLVEELTGGLRLEDAARVAELRFVPSFWAGPLTLFRMIRDHTWVILFPARPRNVSLIPGDPVPDSLLRTLQAVSDQSRLRILKLLGSTPLTQAQIARELRLRPPTITHHLRILRFANLVRMSESVDGEKRYSLRKTRLNEVPGDLLSYIVAEQ